MSLYDTLYGDIAEESDRYHDAVAELFLKASEGCPNCGDVREYGDELSDKVWDDGYKVEIGCQECEDFFWEQVYREDKEDWRY